MKSAMHNYKAERFLLTFATHLTACLCTALAQITVGPPPPPPTFFEELKINGSQFANAAVAVSGDGTTAVVGEGTAVTVYTLNKNTGTFTKIAQLTDGVTVQESFGSSVAISSDGTVIVVGASSADAPSIPGCTIGGGAAYVFVRP